MVDKMARCGCCPHEVGRRTIGRGCPGSYEKPHREFLPSLGLVTGEGEGGDVRTGTAF